MKTNIKIQLLFFISLSLICSSCYEDKGNYEYGDRETIQVNGLESSYTVNLVIDELNITPEVKTEKGDDFEYLWFKYPKTIPIYQGPSDTLSHEKDLRYTFIKDDLALYQLVFCITNKKTHYTEYKTMDLTLTSGFLNGWYVLKDNGTNTDVDYFMNAGDNTFRLDANLFSQVNNKTLKGKAKKIEFVDNFSILNDQLDLITSKGLILLSEHDISFVALKNLYELGNAETLWSENPETIKPQLFKFTSRYFHLVNNNLMYGLGEGNALGVFGDGASVQGLYGDEASNLEISEYAFFPQSTTYCGYLYDNNSGSFITLSSGALKLASGPDDSPLAPDHNGYKCLYMGYGANDEGFAILENKNDVSDRLITSFSRLFFIIISGNVSIEKTAIEADSHAAKGSLFTIANSDNTLYFVADGGNVYERRVPSGKEELFYTLEAGEKVEFIRYQFGYVMIGLSINDTSYKVKFFNQDGTKSELEFDGEGICKDIIKLTKDSDVYSFIDNYL